MQNEESKMKYLVAPQDESDHVHALVDDSELALLALAVGGARSEGVEVGRRHHHPNDVCTRPETRERVFSGT